MAGRGINRAMASPRERPPGEGELLECRRGSKGSQVAEASGASRSLGSPSGIPKQLQPKGWTSNDTQRGTRVGKCGGGRSVGTGNARADIVLLDNCPLKSAATIDIDTYNPN